MCSQNDMIYVMDSSVRGDYCQARMFEFPSREINTEHLLMDHRIYS